MAYETLVAVYDTMAHAEAAAAALRAGGFAGSDISVLDERRFAADRAAAAKPGFWARLFGDDLYEHEATIYGDVLRRGGAVVSLRVLDSEVAHANGILTLHRPVDVHDRALTAGIVPAARVEAVQEKLAAVPLAPRQQVAVSAKLADAHDEVLRLAEEQLQVGKERVESGSTRVRRFVTERAVSANVTLHEEHAEVVRRAVSDPTYLGKIDWADAVIETVETAEHALVSKTARIVEEVSLKKVGSDHVETITEKLRRQQVEIERLGADGRVVSA